MKVYKGYELIKEIAEGNIKEGTRFKNKSFRHEIIHRQGLLYIDNQYHSEISVMCYLNEDFELIEDQTIDIDSISELYSASDTDDTINELIRAVKHLNKEIQSIKEKTDE